MTTPLLLPTPRHLALHGGYCADGVTPSLQEDASLPAEGYRLHITTNTVEIAHADAAGLRHARATLAQLAAQGPLPCATIEDHPRFAVRGLMLDCSRDRIPTAAELRRLLAQMASWKMNHLQLYCEHPIRYVGHEEVAPADGFTLDELRQLSAEAAALGITLAPNQNCFGHLERWFRHPRYEPLAEQEGDPGHHHHCGARALSPAVPGGLELMRDLVQQLSQALPAPVFNIGGDETFDLGQGRSRDLVQREGYAQVYGRFLGEVMAAVRAQGRSPAFWADIVLQHPQAVQHLDPQAIALDWGYGGWHDFDATQQALIEAGFTRRWICPGTSCWSSWGGYSDERRANLRRATRAAERHDCEGLLLTCWGDGGHRQIWPASLAGIAEAAHRFWCGTAIAYEPRAGGLHAFGSPEAGPWLDRLGQLDRPLRDGSRWCTAFRALHPVAPRKEGHPYLCPGAIDPQAAAASEWAAIIADAQQLSRSLPADLDALTTAECQQALHLITLGAQRGVEISGGPPRSRDWQSRLDAAIAEHRRIWLKRARASGLDDSAGAFLLPLG